MRFKHMYWNKTFYKGTLTKFDCLSLVCYVFILSFFPQENFLFR